MQQNGVLASILLPAVLCSDVICVKFFSMKHESLLKRTRSIISHLVFATSLRWQYSLLITLPVLHCQTRCHHWSPVLLLLSLSY